MYYAMLMNHFCDFGVDCDTVKRYASIGYVTVVWWQGHGTKRFSKSDLDLWFEKHKNDWTILASVASIPSTMHVLNGLFNPSQHAPFASISEHASEL